MRLGGWPSRSRRCTMQPGFPTDSRQSADVLNPRVRRPGPPVLYTGRMDLDAATGPTWSDTRSADWSSTSGPSGRVEPLCISESGTAERCIRWRHASPPSCPRSAEYATLACPQRAPHTCLTLRHAAHRDTPSPPHTRSTGRPTLPHRGRTLGVLRSCRREAVCRLVRVSKAGSSPTVARRRVQRGCLDRHRLGPRSCGAAPKTQTGCVL